MACIRRPIGYGTALFCGLDDGSLVLLLVNLLDQPRALTLSLPAPAGDGEAVAEAWVIFEQDRRIDVSTRIFC